MWLTARSTNSVERACIHSCVYIITPNVDTLISGRFTFGTPQIISQEMCSGADLGGGASSIVIKTLKSPETNNEMGVV